jgi:hypothetical protein
MKSLTWAQLKKAANKVPEKLLQNEVVIWTDDERAYKISDIEILKEDYLFDGDEGCAPRSILKEGDPEDFKENEEDYYLIHPKGTRIINAES